ncbi:hypothetical protein ELH66_18270 [Rhizobium ruizarguesonis]|uniref:hypothetical protein n=1 Tax=Rhizobium ruizarguesonis TaxID=2081791 RepID=UPI0010325B17|nr:hypothetical protein [Rhizobium ruizarguesonis]TBA22776.1 hypothetical protein ELH66_18270 [Rhizobium ruizarguesonis]
MGIVLLATKGNLLQSETLWKFRTKNFEIVCEALEPSFVDPLVHDQVVIDAVERGEAVLRHLTARVYHWGVEVGKARLLDSIHVCEPLPEDSEWRHVFDSIIVTDHSYRRKVALWAITDARKNLNELIGALGNIHQ